MYKKWSWQRICALPTQRVEVEIAIAAATLAPTAQIVSTKLEMINASLDFGRLVTQVLDLDFLNFLFIVASSVKFPMIRKIMSKATRTSAAVGFEPTPTPEEELAFQSGSTIFVGAQRIARKREFYSSML
jgi:hypothetical protein